MTGTEAHLGQDQDSYYSYTRLRHTGSTVNHKMHEIEKRSSVKINSVKLIWHSFVFACDVKPLKCKLD